MIPIFAATPRYVTRFKYFLRIVTRQLHLKKLWEKDNGDWKWVKEKATPIASLNRTLWRLSVPTFSFHFMLVLSAIISTLGLLANSVAIIIGAMIIAPLMGPIIGMAYSVAMGNRKLLRRSSLTLFKGIILTIVASWLTASIIGLETVESEILSRTNPTLIDFGIAMAAGLAGAFTQTRRSIADAIPGVAIAVALVPPLSVIGIGLGLGEQEIAVGAFLLFLTNLICIIFFGSLVFLFQSYGNLNRAKKGLAMSTAVMFALGVPLTLSMRDLILKKNVTSQISNLIVEETDIFKNADVNFITVTPRNKFLQIKIEVAAPLDSISQVDIDRLRRILAENINQPIDLRVEVIPLRVIKSHQD
ncbi:TIGR00341 family protein [Waterburya agarophytonicola K14]|uniref:TIGR00341 family protein n=1 Tax=Waterburya agarophytonicola KI4 TaxID=2874699 RepID=A0A964BMZ2_9CYAN|nr:TIGR00341 family protein [Waterburya agarophytonicola]MCC0176434.1 TIGR00341 family protein [Waterburya agarophytonicola KI4]